jgi:hypothetical protein
MFKTPEIDQSGRVGERVCTLYTVYGDCVLGNYQIEIHPSDSFLHREDSILRGSRSSSCWILRNLSRPMIRQAGTGETVLVKNMTCR